MPLLSPRAIVSLYGCGGVPKAPGTVGSLAAMLAAAPIVAIGGSALLAAALAGAIWLGHTSIAKVIEGDGDDPSWIVVDELCGQWLALLAAGGEPWRWLAAFLLFRLLDIVKPFPINLLERRLKGATAVLADDLAAGGIAAAIILLIGAHV